MSEADRRFERFTIPAQAFAKQLLRVKGLSGLLSGFKPCRIKDMSFAGALLHTKATVNVGTKVELKFVTHDDVELVYRAEVVNIGRDVATNEFKLGVRIDEPESETSERYFLTSLERNFKRSP